MKLIIVFYQVQTNLTARHMLNVPDVITSIKSLTSTRNHAKVSQSDFTVMCLKL